MIGYNLHQFLEYDRVVEFDQIIVLDSYSYKYSCKSYVCFYDEINFKKNIILISITFAY